MGHNGTLQALLLVSHSPPPAFSVLYPLPFIFPFRGLFPFTEFPELLVHLPNPVFFADLSEVGEIPHLLPQHHIRI